MSRATRIGSALAGLVVATGMMVGAPAAHAEKVEVTVSERGFERNLEEVFQGDTVFWTLEPDAQLHHSVTSVQEGLFDHVFDPAVHPRTRFEFTFNTPGTYNYYCKFHAEQGMVGRIVVRETASTTTSSTTSSSTTSSSTTSTTATTRPTTSTSATTTPTTAPPTTTPTTQPAGTSSTTRPAGTTTAPTTATTAPKPGVSGASQPTTTTTKKKSTTTTAKKKKTTPASAKPKVERTTTTSTMLPSLAAALPSGAGEVPAAGSEDLPDATEAGEEAASWVGKQDGGKGGGAKKKMMLALGGLGALGLGGAGWRWYNRSSRYLPA